MQVRVLYFAVVRERLGRDAETIELPDGANVGELMAVLAERHEVLSGLRAHCQVALNEALVRDGAVLSDGDEVALIPPVSGGAGTPAAETVARVTPEPLSLDEVVRAVSHAGAGGVVTFTGAVRGETKGQRVVRLEYEAYVPMAEKTLARIAEEVGAAHGAKVALSHRIGVLAVGEWAVVIAASAAHRAEAFAACRETIERLKREAPIWKKEFGEDGAVWVGMGP